VRAVDGHTIQVTYYNAPEAERLRHYYEDLPAKLKAEQIDPRIPWLFGFKLDFRFRQGLINRPDKKETLAPSPGVILLRNCGGSLSTASRRHLGRPRTCPG
jgi:hypothetical protein